MPRGDLGTLIVASSGNQLADHEIASSALREALIQGREAEIRAIIRRNYDSGVAVEILADRVIAPAMAKLGHDWETKRIDVWQEHRGTQMCAAALYDLKEELEARAERNRPLAIGGSPEGDPYFLGSLLAQVVLLDAGWEAINLGPNTPLPSLTKALRELRPRLLWLSVSYLEDRAAFIDAYQDLTELPSVRAWPWPSAARR